MITLDELATVLGVGWTSDCPEADREAKVRAALADLDRASDLEAELAAAQDEVASAQVATEAAEDAEENASRDLRAAVARALIAERELETLKGYVSGATTLGDKVEVAAERDAAVARAHHAESLLRTLVRHVERRAAKTLASYQRYAELVDGGYPSATPGVPDTTA